MGVDTITAAAARSSVTPCKCYLSIEVSPPKLRRLVRLPNQRRLGNVIRGRFHRGLRRRARVQLHLGSLWSDFRIPPTGAEYPDH